MKVAIDYTPALKQRGGIGRYTRGLVQALASIDRDREYLLLASRDAPPDDFPWPDNFRVKRLPVSERAATIVWQRLRLPIPIELFSGPVGIYHSPNYVLPPIRRAFSIVTIHDLSFWKLPEYAEPSLSKYLKAAVPRAVARANHILADSEATRRDIVELLEVPPEKVTVVYSGVEPRFRPTPEAAERVRAKYRLGSERFILSLGTLEPRKNFDGLVRAFSLAKQSGSIPHHLVIAGGKGWLYEGIFREVEASPYHEQIHMIGFVDEEDLPALYSASDLFAYPSHYEGFGLPPLESMACGTPVLAARNSSLPEVLGNAAIWVTSESEEEIAEGLVRALTDEELRRSLITAGLRQAREFTWERGASQLLEVYRKAEEAR